MIKIKRKIKEWIWDKSLALRDLIEDRIYHAPDWEALFERLFIWTLCVCAASGLFAIPTFFILYFWPKTWILITALLLAGLIGTIGYLIAHLQAGDTFGFFDSRRRFKLVRYSWIGRPNLWINVNPDNGVPEFENLSKYTRRKWYDKLKSIEEPVEHGNPQDRFKELL